MVDEQELNKKLAEWAGFEECDIKKYYYWKVGGERVPKWLEPNTLSPMHIKLPNFTQSLDTCFKWLVPKTPLQEIYIQPVDEGWQVDIERGEYWATATTPALALCLAIDKLIDGGK